MLFNYKAIDSQGIPKTGGIDAVNLEVAIASLQRRGFVITYIKPAGDSNPWFSKNISLFDRIKSKDIVILSRQLATLFEAQVSALRIFRLLSQESDNRALRKKLVMIADDLQAGDSISRAMSKHPSVFSDFYVNMVRAGEESGKLDQVFLYLADYLDRSYAVTSKVKNALIYPAFVIVVFIGVMIVMLTKVIPKITEIIKDSGQELPIYTKIVIGVSDFFLNYGFIVLALVVIGGYFLWRYIRTEKGRLDFDTFKVSVPYVGTLFRNLYLGRITDNISTMLVSGIPIAKTIHITGSLVGNALYEKILKGVEDAVTTGHSISESFSGHREIPGIVVQMVKVGEESGELSSILKTLAKFYDREVETSVDTVVDLVEPVMIVVLGVGVAILLAAVIIPIYNFSGTIQ